MGIEFFSSSFALLTCLCHTNVNLMKEKKSDTNHIKRRKEGPDKQVNYLGSKTYYAWQNQFVNMNEMTLCSMSPLLILFISPSQSQVVPPTLISLWVR